MAGFSASVTRRMVQTPEMRAQIENALSRATKDVHRRRIKEWARSNEGSFPSLADSRREALAELTLLCDALGSLVAVDPRQFDFAIRLYDGRPTRGWDL